MWGRLVLLSCAIITAHSSPTTHPRPCRQDDNVCLTKKATIIYKQAILGDPSLNIENLDPMYHEKLVANFATITYKVMKTKVTGFGQCDVVNSTLSLKTNKLVIDLVCPFINIAGDYAVNGQLFGVVMEGEGDYTFESTDYYMTVDTGIKLTQDSNGKKYISIKTYKFTADPRGRLRIDMKNLFNGNKELGESVMKFINQNVKAVTNEMQGPVFNANNNKIIKNLNKYLKTRPLDQFIVLD